MPCSGRRCGDSETGGTGLPVRGATIGLIPPPAPLRADSGQTAGRGCGRWGRCARREPLGADAVGQGDSLVFKTKGKFEEKGCQEIFAAIGVSFEEARQGLGRSTVKDGSRDDTPVWQGDQMTTPEIVFAGGWDGWLTLGLTAPNSQELTVTDPVTKQTTIYLNGPRILNHRSAERTAALMLHGGVHAAGLSDADILGRMAAKGYVVKDSNDFTNYVRDNCFPSSQ